jgi:hypothetical protein
MNHVFNEDSVGNLILIAFCWLPTAWSGLQL